MNAKQLKELSDSKQDLRKERELRLEKEQFSLLLSALKYKAELGMYEWSEPNLPEKYGVKLKELGYKISTGISNYSTISWE